MFYISLVVITQDTYRRYRKENEYGIKTCSYKNSKTQRKIESKRGSKSYKIRQKAINRVSSNAVFTGNYFKFNELNFLTKRYRVAEWMKKKNKIILYTLYKRLTLDERTHIC